MTTQTISVTRYHPVLVVLHWLIGLAILGMLFSGYALLENTPNSDPAKRGLLALHMVSGMLIGVFTIVRLIVRFTTRTPAHATSGHASLDRWVPLMHYGFYAVVLGMVATGFGTVIVSGLNQLIFSGSSAPLPPDLTVYPVRVAHGWLAGVLAAMVIVHVAAVAYHHAVRRDKLIARMGFGRRTPTEQGVVGAPAVAGK
jgi:cytochrome b561